MTSMTLSTASIEEVVTSTGNVYFTVGQNLERPIAREYQDRYGVTNEGWRIEARVVLTPLVPSSPE